MTSELQELWSKLRAIERGKQTESNWSTLKQQSTNDATIQIIDMLPTSKQTMASMKLSIKGKPICKRRGVKTEDIND
jgi:hypothetical protein